MIKVTTSKFFEDNEGRAYEVQKIRRTDSNGQTRESTQIIKRPHLNRDVDVEDSTKSLIEKISKGSSNE